VTVMQVFPVEVVVFPSTQRAREASTRPRGLSRLRTARSPERRSGPRAQ
jgi:hypothetical protein